MFSETRSYHHLTIYENLDNKINILLIKGHETNVAAMNFFLQLLAEHPECQQACQEEVDELFNSKEQPGPDKHLSMDDLSQLKYVERCIMESLRMAPSVPKFYRELYGPVQIDDFKFKKGTIICIPTWSIHR